MLEKFSLLHNTFLLPKHTMLEAKDETSASGTFIMFSNLSMTTSGLYTPLEIIHVSLSRILNVQSR